MYQWKRDCPWNLTRRRARGRRIPQCDPQKLIQRTYPRYQSYPNAPSGASTAGPHFGGGRFGANDCVPQGANSYSTFDVCVLGYACHLQISEFLCMFLTISVDLDNIYKIEVAVPVLFFRSAFGLCTFVLVESEGKKTKVEDRDKSSKGNE